MWERPWYLSILEYFIGMGWGVRTPMILEYFIGMGWERTGKNLMKHTVATSKTLSNRPNLLGAFLDQKCCKGAKAKLGWPFFFTTCLLTKFASGCFAVLILTFWWAGFKSAGIFIYLYHAIQFLFGTHCGSTQRSLTGHFSICISLTGHETKPADQATPRAQSLKAMRWGLR